MIKGKYLFGGFTLIELLTVVAIIGILSSIAIPSFLQILGITYTNEAKLQLAALYQTQTSFYNDYGTFGNCLARMGYNPHGDIANRRYYIYTTNSLGLAGNPDSALAGSTCAYQCTFSSNVASISQKPEDLATLGTATNPTVTTAYNPGRQVNGVLFDSSTSKSTWITKADIYDSTNNDTTCTPPDAVGKPAKKFMAVAAGYIHPLKTTSSNEADHWSIDELKNLVHENTGY